MTESVAASAFPADPYPGVLPDWSFVADGLPGTVWPLTADDGAASGWRIGRTGSGPDLDDWLAGRAEPLLAQRIPALSYGSNRCPSKVDWLRAELGLTGAVVGIRVQVRDVAAVWAAGIRARDDQRPATLAASPGTVEDHVLWFATPQQLRVLDVCEGRDVRYRLVRLHSGVVTDGARRFPDVLTYVAMTAAVTPDGGGDVPLTSRFPLLVDGVPVRCAEVGQAAARGLRGTAATTDGLRVSDVDGVPVADGWPRELFVYGTLAPGEVAWPVLAPHVDGEPRRTSMAGTLFDTGLGYPALTTSATGGARVPGWVVRLREPVAALAVLDDYEGAQYRRVRRPAADGTPCWTYLWLPQVEGMTELSAGWSAHRRATE